MFVISLDHPTHIRLVLVLLLTRPQHLCHLAVTGLINRKRLQWPMDDVQGQLIGQRIARNFANDQGDGVLLYRGTIAGIDTFGTTLDEVWFLIRYDDDDMEACQVRTCRLDCCCCTRVHSSILTMKTLRLLHP
jgi:hypothetical protein